MKNINQIKNCAKQAIKSAKKIDSGLIGKATYDEIEKELDDFSNTCKIDKENIRTIYTTAEDILLERERKISLAKNLRDLNKIFIFNEALERILDDE